MRAAGFALVGGESKRMGQDKALLAFRGIPLAQHAAQILQQAVSSVTLLSFPERYSALGWPVWQDGLPRRGPIGGLQTALQHSPAEWQLLLACDMPFVPVSLLTSLLEAATQDADVVLPITRDGKRQPACALYHRRCLASVDKTIGEGQYALTHLCARLSTQTVNDCEPDWFANLNTPEEWARSVAASR